MAFTTVVCFLVLAEYLFFTWMTGRARGRYDVKAPATTGNEMFERYLRVQQNTVEQLVPFVPAVLGFAYFLSDVVAAGIGLLFFVGRLLYFRGYVADPSKRGLGMILTFLPNVLLVLGALVGAALQVMRSAAG